MEHQDLLKVVTLDIKEDLYQAWTKALGLISNFVTSPSWRLIEAPCHMLDMNIHFQTRLGFRDEAKDDTVKMDKFMS